MLSGTVKAPGRAAAKPPRATAGEPPSPVLQAPLRESIKIFFTIFAIHVQAP